MKYKFLRIKLILLSALLLAGLTVKAESEANKLNIYSVNYPLKYFAEKISGDYAKVTMPMPNDIDPAFWQPDTDSIIAFQNADLIILNGAGYAKWLPKVSLPRASMIDTSIRFQDEYIHIENTTTHKHGSGGEHAHKGTAFTTWLDFTMAIRQAELIYNSLVKKLPTQQEYFDNNYNLLKASLEKLDQELITLTQDNHHAPLFGSHPVYQYFKKRYKLNLKSVHWEPEEVPSASQWESFSIMLKNHPAKWMLWEGEPSAETVARLEQLGVKSIVFNPSSNLPDQGDFLTEMQKNIDNLRLIFN